MLRSTFARPIAVVAVLLAALAIAGCGVNNIPTFEEAAKAKWSEVLNQYKRRSDLIPNLVESVKGFAEQEKSVLTQVTEARRLFKLAALGLVAAVRIMQLVDARDGGPRPATDIIDATQIPAVTAISAGLEGKTARQKNHHPIGSLAWLSWVTARLGG